MTAISATGEGAPSNEASALPAGPPGPPTSLSATPGDDQVSLTWAAPASDGGSPVTGYDVYGSTTPGTEGSEVQSTVTATASTVSGVADGTPYYFEVTAINAAGESAPSAQVQAVPAVATTTTLASTTTTTSFHDDHHHHDDDNHPHVDREHDTPTNHVHHVNAP